MIHYIYDPVGNIVAMNDAAQETSYYKNAVIEPKRQFAYDALYRLKSGNGRELMGLAKASLEDTWQILPVQQTAGRA